MEQMYKVLIKNNGRLLSPYKRFTYEVGRKYICAGFNTDIYKDCERGLYATGIDGLPYAWRNLPGYVVYEVEVGGKRVEYNQYKRRYSELTLLREVPRYELYKLARECAPRVEYKLEEVLFPVHPCAIERSSPPTDAEIALLHDWIAVHHDMWRQNCLWDNVWRSIRHSAPSFAWYAVCDGIRDSIRDGTLVSVEDSVWDGVRDSVESRVWKLVRGSVWNSCAAYVSTLFISVQKWYGTKTQYTPGVNPFRPGADLWRAGLVPTHYGGVVHLHAGPDMNIVYEALLA